MCSVAKEVMGVRCMSAVICQACSQLLGPMTCSQCGGLSIHSLCASDAEAKIENSRACNLEKSRIAPTGKVGTSRGSRGPCIEYVCIVYPKGDTCPET